MKNLFAWTQPGGNYPGYVSINRDDAGNVIVTVRAAPRFFQIPGYPDGCVECSPGDQVALTIPADQPEAAALTAWNETQP